jgi:arylsulfatase A-like enzyme
VGIAALVWTSALSAGLIGVDRASPARALPIGRPNVVILLTDDQTLEMMRYMPITLGRLANHGLSFSNAVVPNSVCCPSRASILTGNHSSTTGVWDNVGRHGGFGAFARSAGDRSTIATWLHDAGYETGFFGKYLNEYGTITGGRYKPPGWDEWMAYTFPGYHDYVLANIDREGRPTTTRFAGPSSPYSPTFLAEKAVDFIEGVSPTSPLFVFYAPFDPHKAPGKARAIPASQDRGTYSDLEPLRPPSFDEADVSDKPSWIRGEPRIDRAAAAKLHEKRVSMIEALQAVDRAVGDIVQALADHNRLDNTLIAFLSDNGYLFGEHRDEGKNSPYDSATRVPMIIRYDPLVANPGISEENAMNIDLAPTIADVAGIPDVPATDGVSLKPILLDPTTDVRGAFLLEGGDLTPSGHPSYCGARNERFMYVRYADGQSEFYDYQSDPYELNNRIDAGRRGIRSKIRRLRGFAKDHCVPAYPGYHWGSG